MKKLLLFIFVLSFYGVVAQNPPVAVNDTIIANAGESFTVNVIRNDYDVDGDIIKIASVDGSNITSFTDSTITFFYPKYLLLSKITLKTTFSYKLDCEPFHPSCIGYGFINFNKPIIDTLETNEIRTPVYPMNIQFYDAYYDMTGPNYHYPANSTKSPVFSSSLWIGGKDANDDLYFAGERYRQVGSDFWPGPLSNDGLVTTDSINAGNWMRTWKVTKEEINEHIRSFNDADYVMPESILSWPAHGNSELNQDDFIAPFVDVDQDLEYHPELGDYPFIRGDQTVFFIYNDQLEHTESQGAPLGIEIHCMAWAINSREPNNPYESTIFYSYKIFNKSGKTYYDTYLGLFTDLDLGFARDDYLGCHVENGNFYVYNGEEIDGNGEPESYGNQIPSQSVCILSGPFMDNDNMDNPLGECNESINGSGFGDGEVDNERYGMNRFVSFNNSGFLPISDPVNDIDYYNLMQGIWKDESQMVYGGQGHSDNGGDVNFPARFMFPGDSDLCNWGTDGVDPGSAWSEENNNNEPGDRRGTASMGPFTFEAGSVEYLDIAYVTAPPSTNKGSKELLQDYISEIKTNYLENPMNFGYQYTNIEELAQEESLLKIYPNPVNGDQIWFELDELERVEYIIYNSAGQQIISGELQAQKLHYLDVSTLNSGWYLLQVNTKNKTYRSKLVK